MRGLAVLALAAIPMAALPMAALPVAGLLVTAPAFAQSDSEPVAPDVVEPEPLGTETVSPAAIADKEAVRAELERQEYTDIANLRREGDVFVAQARRYGETVEVRVDAVTRIILEPQRLTREQIQNKLEAEGYSNVRDLARDTNVAVYTATADKDGTTMALQINPARGDVMLETPAPE